MACPSCGAVEPRHLIAPGYWECQSTINVGGASHEPAPGHPWMTVPMPRPDYRTCGTRYAEASGPGGLIH